MTADKRELMSVQDALAALLGAIVPVTDIEQLPIAIAHGRVLAEDLEAEINVPPMDNTQMDGYAVRRADCLSAGVTLPISQRIAAGQVGRPLEPGTVARIFTGATIPAGADAVVMQEATRPGAGVPPAEVTIEAVPEPGEWIRRAGEDIAAGSRIMARGRRLRPQDVGLLASVGIAHVPAYRRVRVAIFFTGDELALPGEVLRPGAIYNSSRYTLIGLLRTLGVEVIDLGSVPDSLAATRAIVRKAAEGVDCLITSGGVSVGEEDHVRPAIEAEGELSLWQIAIKPGKPLAFGRVGRAHFIGLPGNPVSSFVTFLMFVRPALLRLSGVSDVTARGLMMRADFAWPKPDRRQEYLRVRMNPWGGLDLYANQGSAVLTSTTFGDGLVENPPGHVIATGDLVRFLPYSFLDCLPCASS